MIGILIGIIIIGAAAGILGKRAYSFVRTKGQSACANCPYSGHCSGGCHK